MKIILALVGLCLGLLGTDFVRFADRVAALEPDPANVQQQIVVLTGGSGIRIRRAVELLEQDRTRHVLVSGVNESVSEETLAAELDIDPSLFACCIDIGYNAGSTIGNAQEVADWMQSHNYTQVTVVTSNYHMPRAMIELRHKNPTATLYPYPVITQIDPATWPRNPRAFRGLLREWLKYRVTKIRRA